MCQSPADMWAEVPWCGDVAFPRRSIWVGRNWAEAVPRKQADLGEHLVFCWLPCYHNFLVSIDYSYSFAKIHQLDNGTCKNLCRGYEILLNINVCVQILDYSFLCAWLQRIIFNGFGRIFRGKGLGSVPKSSKSMELNSDSVSTLNDFLGP